MNAVGDTAPARGREARAAMTVAENGKLDDRSLRFIYGGDYLRKTWLFFNRYLIGLLLVWVVLLSALLMVASFSAWLFRCLDYPAARTAIATLGFDDDVKLAFFPSFIVGLLWLGAWGLSYWKRGPRASGAAARTLFFVLVVVTLIAVAALLGTGDIAFVLNDRVDASQGANVFSKVLLTVLITAIVTSLLPYLAPKRLLRSGVSQQTAVEKYVFWAATRALAYGLPFAAVAYFARENISGWNERRDDRITRSELADWSAASPLWRDLLVTPGADSRGTQPLGQIWPSSSPPADSPQATNLTAERRQVQSLLQQLFETVRAREVADTDPTEAEEIQQERQGVAAAIKDTDNVSPSYHHVAESRTISGDASRSFGNRWRHLAVYLLHSTFLEQESVRQNPFYRSWSATYRCMQLQDQIAHSLNKRLVEPRFYEEFWPITDAGASSTEAKGLLAAQRRTFDALGNGDDDANGAPDEPEGQSSPDFAAWRSTLNALANEAKTLAQMPLSAWGSQMTPAVARPPTKAAGSMCYR
jgi:hypothetical protein